MTSVRRRYQNRSTSAYKRPRLLPLVLTTRPMIFASGTAIACRSSNPECSCRVQIAHKILERLEEVLSSFYVPRTRCYREFRVNLSKPFTLGESGWSKQPANSRASLGESARLSELCLFERSFESGAFDRGSVYRVTDARLLRCACA